MLSFIYKNKEYFVPSEEKGIVNVDKMEKDIEWYISLAVEAAKQTKQLRSDKVLLIADCEARGSMMMELQQDCVALRKALGEIAREPLGLTSDYKEIAQEALGETDE